MILFIFMIGALSLLGLYIIGEKSVELKSNYSHEWDNVVHNPNVISKEDYELWSPFLEVENFENSMFNKEEVFQYYLEINYLYRKEFDHYLKSKLDFKYYNDILKECVNEKKPDNYKKYSEMDLDFIYVRSFPFVERLSNSEIELLYERVIKDNYEVDGEIMNLIDSTYDKCYLFTMPNSKKWDRWAQKIGITNQSSDYSIGSPYEVDKDAIWISIYGDEIIDPLKFEETKNLLQTELEEILNCKVNVIFL